MDLGAIQLYTRSNRVSWYTHNNADFMTNPSRLSLLGVVANEDRIRAIAGTRPKAYLNTKYPPYLDWRDYNAINYVTTPRMQGYCGTSISFSIVGVLESMALRQGRSVRLSEGDLHYCSVHGPSCDGWWLDDGYDSALTRGVVDANLFPYNPDGKCLIVPDRDNHIATPVGVSVIQEIADRKLWLANVGPMSALMTVYEDFLAYGGGVYQPLPVSIYQMTTPMTPILGTQAVIVVGYSELDDYWICKNSWGTDWGEKGFFRIRMRYCKLEMYPFWGVSAITFAPKFFSTQLNSRSDNILWGTVNEALASSVYLGWQPEEVFVACLSNKQVLYSTTRQDKWQPWSQMPGTYDGLAALILGSNLLFFVITKNVLNYWSFDTVTGAIDFIQIDQDCVAIGAYSQEGQILLAKTNSLKEVVFGVFSLENKTVFWNKNIGGAIISSPIMTVTQTGTVMVIGIGTDKALYYKLSDDDIWSEYWYRLDANLYAPPALVSIDEAFYLFAIKNMQLMVCTFFQNVWTEWEILEQGCVAIAASVLNGTIFLAKIDQSLSVSVGQYVHVPHVANVARFPPMH